MASLVIVSSHNPYSLQLTQRHRPPPPPPPRAAAPTPRGLLMANSPSTAPRLHLHQLGGHTKIIGLRRRGMSVVTRAGPSTTSYIFAFVFPLSLLAVTIFASMRVADKLDQKFLEELAVNQAILEGNEDDGNGAISTKEEPAPARMRNRPKREVESSSA